MVSVVEIWKLNSASHLYGKKRWNECQIFLRDLFCEWRSWSGKRAVKINDGQGRLRGENTTFGNDLIAFCLDGSRIGLREFYASLYDSTS